MWHPVTASLLIKSQKGVSNCRQTCARQHVKNCHGITERPHLIDPRPMDCRKQYGLLLQLGQFENGGLIPWNAVAICETSHLAKMFTHHSILITRMIDRCYRFDHLTQFSCIS